jgi:hypothetical protein
MEFRRQYNCGKGATKQEILFENLSANGMNLVSCGKNSLMNWVLFAATPGSSMR